MKNKISVLGVLSIASLSLLLASCNTTTRDNYPENANDPIVNIADNPYDSYQYFYDSINTGDTVASRTLDKILLKIADDKMKADTTWITDEWMDEKVEETLMNAVTSGSYDTDYKFNEMKYVNSLTQNLYNITCPDTGANKDYVITPDSEFSDIFFCNYDDYIEKQIKPQIIRNRLVADYIYNESYSSIGSTNARDVKIVAITDSTDHPGMARRLVNYFFTYYIDTEEPLDGAADLDVLARLWKGVDIKATDGTTKAQLEDMGIITMYDEIQEDRAKIILDDKYATDLTLESQYTGNYTYSVEKGMELAENNLRKQDFITEGYYLKSNGLTSLPTELKNRIFTSNFNVDPASTRRDVTRTMKNGKRYLTAPLSEQGTSDDVVYYDASSKTYYIVEINDVITNTALQRSASDSEEVAADKRERALTVAYEMTGTSNYTRNATTFFLEEANIEYHDEDVYNYILTNYPDVFEDDDD